MKNRVKISDENLLMIILALMSFAIGIWENYRQLWLESNGFDIVSISRIYSTALICSSIISFIISVFSSKVKIRSVILLSIIFRIISLITILNVNNVFITKSCFLLCIMCDIIFSISFYPMLTYVTKTEESFKKKTLIEYFARDIGIVGCGLLIGVYIGKYLFSYNTCLLISLIVSIIALIFCFNYKSNEKKSKDYSMLKSLKRIMNDKINRVFIINEVIIKISYGVVFSLIMLILVNYINLDISVTSVYIIVVGGIWEQMNNLILKLHKI